MISPADPPEGAGVRGPGLRLLAVTACPTGIAHTYMAAEKLAQAAQALGHEIKVETQGSIGAENVLTDNDVKEADGIIVAADKDVDLSRFVGKRVLTVGVAEGIHHPERLIDRVRTAPVHRGDGAGAAGAPGAEGGRERGALYKALMNGVSYMIPFVVVGGLLIAVSLALGGHTTPQGIVFHSSFWQSVNDIGVIGFTLMIPILSGYIAYAVGDRPALVPGMVGGWIASHGELYDSKAGAGFIGAIATGFLAGYLVRWIRKVEVPEFVRPIMPVIVIPILATSAVGLFFIYVIGRPIAWVFEHLTDWLGSLTGTSAALLGVLLGLMIAFDMGGPVNKTAFLFGAGLVSRNPEIMGMCAAAIPVPPLGQGLATVLRRGLFTQQERETGLAALFMGLFGITEGAIPFAAARPARVIPANMLGGAVAGAVAGLAAVKDSVPHGGPVVAALGAVGGVPMFFVAIAVGTVVTALTTVTLMGLGGGAALRVPGVVTAVPAVPPAPDGGATGVTGAASALSGHLTEATVRPWLAARSKEEAIREMAGLLAAGGRVTDPDGLVGAVLAREALGTTGLGEEIAIPHAKTDAVAAPVVGFSRSEEGIEWGAPDGTRARLIFMIAVPEVMAGDEHLRILAMLSRKLMDPGFRERLLSAGGVGAVVGVLAEVS
ncbi:PTS fructose transporter subunit IIC [Streptomyces eurocidicus]|uniref:PTS fructose transporter subunit IIC n=1 Tax=Streptomyces eurocidicus TaxID=66423 RepID=A0A2N8NM12_STREU|nr:fructose-specific PTS transporter subunit EIIC [Streptomyces eurocidicus]MBB5123024.1 PTS system fructose-specific IIC component [Streptomyces eurocidicus]MBF6054869.1 PTS fructose transporter subunit IIC [Streptomyces eurocidicus]PNE29808.1 PTS fructose transporter subunit IIC [Streptomyces eurocidicus]